MTLSLTHKFKIGQQVYLIVNPQVSVFITGYLIRMGNQLSYLVQGESEEMVKYEFELDSEKQL